MIRIVITITTTKNINKVVKEILVPDDAVPEKYTKYLAAIVHDVSNSLAHLFDSFNRDDNIKFPRKRSK